MSADGFCAYPKSFRRHPFPRNRGYDAVPAQWGVQYRTRAGFPESPVGLLTTQELVALRFYCPAISLH